MGTKFNPNKYLFCRFMGIGEGVGAALIGGVASGLVGGLMSSGGSSGGSSGSSGSSGGTSGFQPYGLNAADDRWNVASARTSEINQMLQGATSPAYNKAYANAQQINYDPYQQASNQAGQVYGGMATIAGQQVKQFGQQGREARDQQRVLYGAGEDILNAAQDPQNALYTRTQGQLTDQVRAGQAARGLGTSPVGAAEENQAMSNFNIDWQNNQLQREATAAQSASGLANAGLGQGNLYNADKSAQLTAGNNQAQMLGQSAQTPLNAQQYIVGMPASDATAYLQNYSNMNALYANQMSSSIPYMNQGIGATQYNATNQIANNSAQGKLFGQAAGAVGSAFGKYLGSDSGGASTGNAYGSSNWQSPIDTSGNFGYTGGTGGGDYSGSFGTTGGYDFGFSM